MSAHNLCCFCFFFRRKEIQYFSFEKSALSGAMHDFFFFFFFFSDFVSALIGN